MIEVAQEILNFWFSDDVKPQWFNSTEALDTEIRQKYQTLWQQAKSGELDDWLDQPESTLALVILLDQVPLNMFRGLPESFATEQQAVKATHDALEKGYADQLPKSQVAFLLMPLMHSESTYDQQKAVEWFEHLVWRITLSLLAIIRNSLNASVVFLIEMRFWAGKAHPKKSLT